MKNATQIIDRQELREVRTSNPVSPSTTSQNQSKNQKKTLREVFKNWKNEFPPQEITTPKVGMASVMNWR